MKNWLLILMLVALCHTDAAAQGCVTCTRNASSLDNESARGLNGGIIYLALLPLGLIGTVGFIWWKRNKNQI